MSIPPTFLDDLRSRLVLSEVVDRKVIWDKRRSNPGRGDWWAPCPFHQEETASFHVDDRKGFYHCFGCHAKGDIFRFVTETENVSFREAVEILAREAGMEMPATRNDPKAAAKRDRETRLVEVMEQAVKLFGLAFRSGGGLEARAYAERRGLTPETLKRFEIGFAPDHRHHLTQVFREKGALAEAVAAGLVIEPDGGGQPYDRFRGRLMFPIRDVRGRCIAFGGRALSKDAMAKYLNSPETELFHKSKVLFNQGPARAASGKVGALIATEGYMDTIALAQAGFDHAVAPLGTAVTEDQLALMWRMAPEPVIALDGDKAGLKAAERLIDLALPGLGPGKSLRFCLMPAGKDPDDVIREGGAEGMQKLLDEAVPLVDMLWRRETAEQALTTPEERAALDKRLREALGRIGDASVRSHYGAELKERRSALFAAKRASQRPARQPMGFAEGQRSYRARRAPGQEAPTVATQNSALVRAGTDMVAAAARLREGPILAIACFNPEGASPLEAALEEMTVRTPDLIPIRDGLISALIDGADPIARMTESLGESPIDRLGKIPSVRAERLASPGHAPAHVEKVLRDAISHHEAALIRNADLADVTRDLPEVTSATAAEIDLDDPAPLPDETAERLYSEAAPWHARWEQPLSEYSERLETALDEEEEATKQGPSELRRMLDALEEPKG